MIEFTSTEVDGVKTWFTTITGANRKILYEGDSELEAARVYKYAMEHYIQREIASQLSPSEESQVMWFNERADA